MGENDFLLQMGLDTAESQRQFMELAAAAKQQFAKGIRVTIDAELDATGVAQAAQAIVAQMSKLTGELAQSEKAMEELRAEAARLGQEIDKEVAGAADRLTTALKEGGDAAAQVIEDIKKVANDRVLDRATAKLRNIVENGVSAKWVTAQGGGDANALVGDLLSRAATARIRRAKTVQALKELPEGSAEAASYHKKLAERDAELKSLSDSLMKAFSGNVDEVKRAIKAFDEADNLADTVVQLGDRIQAFVKTLTEANKHLDPVNTKQHELAKHALKFEKYEARYRSLLPTGPEPKKEKTPKPPKAAPAAPEAGAQASTTEMAMDRLRRKPIQISLRMNCSRISDVSRVSGGDSGAGDAGDDRGMPRARVAPQARRQRAAP